MRGNGLGILHFASLAGDQKAKGNLTQRHNEGRKNGEFILSCIEFKNFKHKEHKEGNRKKLTSLNINMAKHKKKN